MSNNSCLNNIQVKYCGLTKNATTKDSKTTVIYQGKKSDCEAFYNSHAFGDVDENYGSIESIRLYQEEGPFWNVEVTYSITTSVNVSYSSGTKYGPTDSTLNCRMMTMPLEKRPNYKAKWNHYLFSKYGYLPDFWDTATNTKLSINERQEFKWGSSASECPENWAEVGDPTKPRCRWI